MRSRTEPELRTYSPALLPYHLGFAVVLRSEDFLQAADKTATGRPCFIVS